MPRGDRTGPRGMGPMTGRGMGYCAGYDIPGYANPGPGIGRGLGTGPGWRGGGRGWRHWYHATGLPGWALGGSYRPAWGYGPYGPPLTEAQEAKMREGEAEALKRELEAITKRLEELEREE